MDDFDISEYVGNIDNVLDNINPENEDVSDELIATGVDPETAIRLEDGCFYGDKTPMQVLNEIQRERNMQFFKELEDMKEQKK